MLRKRDRSAGNVARVQSFGDGKAYLGWAMGAFSLGRAVSAIASGSYEPRSARAVLTVATLCFLFSAGGSVFFVFATTSMQIVLARACTGLGAGALAVMISLLAATSSEAARTSIMSDFYLAASIGEIAGPLVVAATASVAFSFSGVRIDSLNSAGVWSFAVFVVAYMAAAKSFWRKGTMREAQSRQGDETSAAIIEPLSCLLISKRMTLLLALAIVDNAAVASWETLVVPLGQTYFGWTVSANAWIYVASGVILLLSSMCVSHIASRGVSDEVATVAAVFASIVGSGMLVGQEQIAATDASSPSHPFYAASVALFLAGNTLYILGAFSLLPLVVSMWTKSLPPSRRGFFVGAFRAVGAMSRVAGNLAAAATLPAEMTDSLPSPNGSRIDTGDVQDGDAVASSVGTMPQVYLLSLAVAMAILASPLSKFKRRHLIATH